MNPLVIRTAFPLGYLFAGIVLLALAAGGLVLVVQGIRRNRGRRVALGAAIMLFVAYVVWVNNQADQSLELNPVVTAQSLSGRWVNRDAALLLRPAGRYECTGPSPCVGLGSAGAWSRQGDFDVRLEPDHPATTAAGSVAGVRYRVVSYDGELRLASPIDHEPDVWDGRFFWSFPGRRR